MRDLEHSGSHPGPGEASSMPNVGPQSSQITSYDSPTAASTDEVEDNQPERASVMDEFHISYDGRSYQYNGYRYDGLADAVGYAKLMRSQSAHDNPAGPFVPHAMASAPSEADRAVMIEHGIEFEAGWYRFGGYRYDRLADAVDYARSL